MISEELKKKVKEIKLKHGITEVEMIRRLPLPMGFRGKPTEGNIINLLDLIYG